MLVYGFMKIATYIGAILGLLFLFGSMADDSAPRMAAHAAVAIGLAVIPYVITRLIAMTHHEEQQRIRHEKMMKVLERIAPPAELD